MPGVGAAVGEATGDVMEGVIGGVGGGKRAMKISGKVFETKIPGYGLCAEPFSPYLIVHR